MREPSAKPRPNILMIVADQHRWDCVGAAGRYPVHTPNLDALASDGVWFDSAFTPIPLCTPARQSLLTGRRPEQAGGLWNYDIGPAIIDFQPGGQVWPQLLRSSGYLNGYVGKWHVDAQRTPRDFGYDTYVPLEDYDPWRAAQGLSPVDGDWFGGVDPAPLEQTRTHWCADRAIEFLNRAVADPGRPWHLRLDLVEPHLPCQPAAVFADRYDPASVPRWSAFEDRLIGKPYIQRQQRLNWAVEDWGWGDWAPVVARYYAIISQLDDAIGRLLAALAATGQAAGHAGRLYRRPRRPVRVARDDGQALRDVRRGRPRAAHPALAAGPAGRPAMALPGPQHPGSGRHDASGRRPPCCVRRPW